MEVSKSSQNAGTTVILYGLLFLLFFQLISDFIESVYAFGLLATSLTADIASVVFLLSPLLLVLIPQRWWSGRLLLATGLAMVLCRVVSTLVGTRAKMLVSGAGVACFLILVPLLLWHSRRTPSRNLGLRLGTGLALGLSLSLALRTLNSGIDISAHGGFRGVGWLLAATTALLLFLVYQSLPAQGDLSPAQGSRHSGAGRTTILGLGLTGILVILYFAFMSPSLLSGWTRASYLPVVVGLAVAVGLFTAALSARPQVLSRLPGPAIVAGNLLFVLALELTILAHQISFPTSAAGYPLTEPPAASWGYPALALLILLSPILFLDWKVLVEALVAGQPSLRALSGTFTVAGLALLILVFSQVFTTVYDYIPVVGPLFRDKFWLVLLVPGLIVVAAVFLALQGDGRQARGHAPSALAGVVPAAALLLAGISSVAALVTVPSPALPAPGAQSLRVLTYNIQQGYSEDGVKNYEGQLRAIREIDADIVGLQESDTNRISGGSFDISRYFAHKLDLHAYYGPTVVAGTFGLALLSKYPIENPRTIYLYSEGEQTAAVLADIAVDGTVYHVVVTHLGNGGPLVQQENLLDALPAGSNLIVMGDFNFKPDSEQYGLTTTQLQDAWLLAWPSGVDDQGLDPRDRIDHIFLSRDLSVRDARYLYSPASDHPALTVELTIDN